MLIALYVCFTLGFNRQKRLEEEGGSPASHCQSGLRQSSEMSELVSSRALATSQASCCDLRPGPVRPAVRTGQIVTLPGPCIASRGRRFELDDNRSFAWVAEDHCWRVLRARGPSSYHRHSFTGVAAPWATGHPAVTNDLPDEEGQ